MINFSVKGKNIEIGDALRQHVKQGLERLLDKYFGDAIDANVTFAKDAHLFRVQISVHIGRGILLQSEASAPENAYTTFDMGAEHLAKRLRRYKRRLRDHHRAETDSFKASQYIIAQEAHSEEETEEAPLDANPAIIAEMHTDVPKLTVSEAVMRLDLSGSNALLFTNSAHGGLNMVYRRVDGNIGWVDPKNA